MLRKLLMLWAATMLAVSAVIGAGWSSRALADHVNTTQCFPFGGGYTFCLTEVGATNTTTTPSGNESDTFNGTTTYALYNSSNTLVASETIAGHFHSLYQNGVLQEEGNHATFSAFPGPTGGTCTATVAYHVTANGVQYDNVSFSGDCS